MYGRVSNPPAPAPAEQPKAISPPVQPARRPGPPPRRPPVGGGRLVEPWWATSPWAVLLVRARAGLKPAPMSASPGRGGGPGLLAGWTVGIGRWRPVGGTVEGDIALGCSAGAGAGGFETRPYVCLFGTRWGGRAFLRVGRWGLVGGGWSVEPWRAISPWAVLLVRGRAGLKPAPTSASPAGAGGFETRPYVCLSRPRWGAGPPCGLDGGDWSVAAGWWNRGGRYRLGLFCWCGRGRV